MLSPYKLSEAIPLREFSTLKARCSRKWAVPEVASVSARDPASIQIPTVAVWRKGEYSVATERPFERVVVCVGRMREFAGVARARVTRGEERGRRTEETAFRVRAEGTSSLEAAMARTMMTHLHVREEWQWRRGVVQRQLDGAGTVSTTVRIASVSAICEMGCGGEMAMAMPRMEMTRQTQALLSLAFSLLENSLMHPDVEVLQTGLLR